MQKAKVLTCHPVNTKNGARFILDLFLDTPTGPQVAKVWTDKPREIGKEVSLEVYVSRGELRAGIGA